MFQRQTDIGHRQQFLRRAQVGQAVFHAGPHQTLQDRRSIEQERPGFDHAVADVTVNVPTVGNQIGNRLFHGQVGIVRRNRLAVLADMIGHRGQGGHQRIAIRQGIAFASQRVRVEHGLGGFLGGDSLNDRAHGEFVNAGIDFRNPSRSGQNLFVVAVVIQFQDVFHFPFFEFHLEVTMGAFAFHIDDLHFIKTGRQGFDEVQGRGDLFVLLLGHRSRDENPQMADAVMHRIDDALTAGLDFANAGIGVDDPVQGLGRRRNVVAVRREDDHRGAHIAQIDVQTTIQIDAATGQFVADEQVFDNPADFVFVHEIEAGPPAFEFQETFGPVIHVGKDFVILFPKGVGGVHVFEILDQIGPVEFAIAQIGQHHGRPQPAQDPTGIAHGRFAAHAGPIGHGRTVQHHRTGQVGIGGGQQHGRPTALAVADDHRLGGRRVTMNDFADEMSFGPAHIGDGLTGNRMGGEDHEIHRMAVFQGHTHFALILEPADARTVAGAGVDDDVGTDGRIDGDARRGVNMDQRIIHRLFQGGAVDDHIEVVDQNRRAALGFMMDEHVAALAHDVDEQHRALAEIHQIFLQSIDIGILRDFLGQFLGGIHMAIQGIQIVAAQTLGENFSDLFQRLDIGLQIIDLFFDFIRGTGQIRENLGIGINQNLVHAVEGLQNIGIEHWDHICPRSLEVLA